MKKGEIVYAATHAEFLNEVIGVRYKRYMKCTYSLSDGKTLWMIRLNGTESNTGWINSLSASGEEIYEVYTGNPNTQLRTHKNYVGHEVRVVFDIIESAYSGRKYVFRGLFVFDPNADNKNRIWRKISDTYSF